jgi:quercetin dioxygenase-like cupin family protein
VTDPQSLLTNADAFAEGRRAAKVNDPVIVSHVRRGELSSTVLAVIRPGGGLRPHYHRDHDEIIVFLSGKAKFLLGDDVHDVSAHDVISVPAGVTHATLEAERECVLAAVFSPGFDLADEDRVYVDSRHYISGS